MKTFTRQSKHHQVHEITQDEYEQIHKLYHNGETMTYATKRALRLPDAADVTFMDGYFLPGDKVRIIT